MNKYEEMVSECHRAMESAVNEPYSVELLELRRRLINEETAELSSEIDSLIAELKNNNKVNKETVLRMYKELADLQYVLSGTVVSLNIPFEEVFKRVHESNMSKLVDGKPLKRADGKFLKGPNYKKPDLSDLYR